MEKKKSNTKNNFKKHKSHQLTPELSTQSNTLSKNPKINIYQYLVNTITKSKNTKIITKKKKKKKKKNKKKKN